MSDAKSSLYEQVNNSNQDEDQTATRVVPKPGPKRPTAVAKDTKRADKNDTKPDGETNNSGDAATPSTSEGDNTPPGWEDVFPDQTPTQVKDTLEQWRHFSKTWEDRAKTNHKQIKALEKQLEDTPRNTDVERLKAENKELALQLKLVETLSELGADVAELVDSRRFMAQATKLDVDDEMFYDQVKNLVEDRARALPPTTRGGLFGREARANNTPVLFYDRINNNK